MVFPAPFTIVEKLDIPAANRFDFDNYALKKEDVDPLDGVRSYLQQCEADGRWSGSVGTCKSQFCAFYSIVLSRLGYGNLCINVLVCQSV